MKPLLYLILVVFLFVGFMSCDNSDVAGPTKKIEPVDGSNSSVEDLVGPTWPIDSFISSDGESIEIEAKDKYLIEFTREDSSNFSASTSCNDFWGEYRAEDGGELDISLSSTTLVGCPADHPEPKLKKALEDASEYEVEGDRLRIAFGSEGILTYQK